MIRGFSLSAGAHATITPAHVVRGIGIRAEFEADVPPLRITGETLSGVDSDRNQGVHVEPMLWLLMQLRGFAAKRSVAASDLACDYLARGVAAFRDWNQDGAVVLAAQGRLLVVAPKVPGVPVYVRMASGLAYIASEILALGGGELHLVADALDEERMYGAPHLTAFEGVFAVPAGHYCMLEPERGTARLMQYWSPPPAVSKVSDAHLSQRITQALDAAIRLRAPAAAVSLVSGGLDSSLVSALAVRQGCTLRTFSLGSAEHNEFSWARMLAEHLGTTHSELLIEHRDLTRSFAEVVAIAEHPFVTYLEYLVPGHVALKRCVRPGDTVLSGYGSDVLFAGFGRVGMSVTDIAFLIDDEYRSALWANECAPLFGAMHGVDVVNPFFDAEVVALSLAIEPGLKFRDGTEKWVLRKAAEPLLPPAIAWRKKIGIHESTGMRSYLSTLVDPANTASQAEILRRKKRLALSVLELTHVRRIPADTIEIEQLAAEPEREDSC